MLYLLLFTVFFGVTFWYTFVMTLHSGRIRVPGVTGITLDEAGKMLEEVNLSYVLDASLSTESGKIQAGLIAVQEPSAGRVVIKGSRIHLGMSLGAPHIAVPSLLTKNIQEAKFILQKSGLKLGSISSIPYPADPGRIIAVTPPGETLVTRGTEVHALVSSPQSPTVFVMPNCLGKIYRQVKRDFEIRGFTLSGIREKAVSYYPDGIILHQFPSFGHPVRPGDVISFTVNREVTNE